MSTAQTGRTHDLHPTASKKPKKSLDPWAPPHMTQMRHRPAIPISEFMGHGEVVDYSGLMFANLVTLRHFSVSAAICLPKSAGEPESTVPPRSARRAWNSGSASAALISLLSFPMISAGVPVGTPTPYQMLAS